MMMSRIAVCIGAFVVLLVASALAGPVTLNGAKISATFNPTGGSIRIWETGTNKFFTHSFTKIQEVAADGGVVNAVNSFADLTFNDPTTPQQETFQGVNATVVSMSGNVNVAVAGSNATTTANVNVRFYFFNDEGEITYGTKTYPVAPGSIEIIYTISGWPVDDTSNKLNFFVRIGTPGKTASWKSPALRFFDGASLIFAPDSSNSNGQAAVKVTPTMGSGAVNVEMQFQAANSIEYDPLWSVEGESSSAATLSPFITSVLF